MRLAYDILCVFSFREHAMYHIYLHTLTLYEVFAYFFIYSFLGWVCEVAFHAIKTGKFVNRGFLNGPVCPIYGAGVVVILLILGDYAQQMWAVFLVGIAVPTLLELVTGWLLETFFHDKWWDYSERRFNFKGYICLEFSLLWGIAAVCVISILHLLVRKFAMLFSEIAGTILVCIGLAALLADVILTVLQVLKLNQKLAEIDKLAKAMRAGSGRGDARSTEGRGAGQRQCPKEDVAGQGNAGGEKRGMGREVCCAQGGGEGSHRRDRQKDAQAPVESVSVPLLAQESRFRSARPREHGEGEGRDLPGCGDGALRAAGEQKEYAEG